jgi:hypothetical protein
VSEDLDGVASGSPQVSTDGLFVYLTHNSDDGGNGFFTILDANSTGTVFYSDSSAELGDEPTNAYGPIGIFHSPEEGNYDPLTTGAPISEGDFNTNDMVMWAQTPKPSDISIENGFLFAFQFPRDFIGNASDISFFQMGNFERDFQSLTPPVMTNDGMSAYWSVSRSGFRSWTPKRFSRARSNSIGFTRNEDFPGQPVWAPPALSNDGPEPTVFGGSAAKEFIRMNFDFSEQVVVPTEGYVKTQAMVDGDERVVYYVEGNQGMLHQANFDDLTDIWTFPVNYSVDGEMAITPRSDLLLVADARGVITALQLADIPVTDAPSSMPSDGPSMMPSGGPTISMAPVDATMSPTAAPVVPTDAPVAPTDAPVAPTDAPVVPVVPEPAATNAPVAPPAEPAPEPSSSAAVIVDVRPILMVVYTAVLMAAIVLV